MPRCHGYRRPEASQAHGGSLWGMGPGQWQWQRYVEPRGSSTRCGRVAMAAGPVNGRPHASSHRAGRSSLTARLRPPQGCSGRRVSTLTWRQGSAMAGWSKATVVPGEHPAGPATRGVSPGGYHAIPTAPTGARARPAP